MSHEIEQKFQVRSHDSIVARLESLGAEASARIEQEDTYFNHPSRDFAETNEAFRIRRTGSRNAITYKGPKRAGPTKTREEIEIAFAEGPEAADQLQRLVRSLGFAPVALIRKHRTPYHVNQYGRKLEVALDVAEGVGSFVEVETMAWNEAEIPEAQAAVLELARTLGLADLERRSYLRMALEQRAAAKDG